MRYACLVYLDASKLDALTDDERGRLRREARAFEQDLRRSGHLLGSESLESVRAATTLRVREGRSITIDGPAAETLEELYRILVLEARDLNEALRLAARLPSAGFGSIEIRPIRHGPGTAPTGAGVENPGPPS